MRLTCMFILALRFSRYYIFHALSLVGALGGHLARPNMDNPELAVAVAHLTLLLR